MTNGTYKDFRDALRAFESGWDRARYEAGVIADWQLDTWAGGPVTDFFPEYASWADLDAAQWDAMSYRSMNSLGFVGYQFGEALLIDLGYYDDDVFYGAGAATNTWDGAWTGKNGVTSLADFMTAEKQEVAIQEAFGYNLKVIRDGLAASGQSLQDMLGTTASYVQNGQTVTVELTLTGIMAAAHLRGAWGTLALLQGGAVSTDEYGTSILRYIDQFGGYDAPSVDAAIAFFSDRLTGDEGVGTPGGDGATDGDGADGGANGGDGAAGGHGGAGVTAATADVVIDWRYGEAATVEGFDPAAGTIFVGWIGADALELREQDGDAVFAVPSNNQWTRLAGVSLTDLSAANFTILDATAGAEILALVGDGAGCGAGIGSGGGAGGGHAGAGATTVIALDSGSRVIEGFDPAHDMIHIAAGVTAQRLAMFEESGEALGQTVRIAVMNDAGDVLGTTIFTGIGLAALSLANFSVSDQSARDEIAATLGADIAWPNAGGFEVPHDVDGSSPAQSTGASALGGVRWRADVNADDVTGFDPLRDQVDFGDASVHGLIVTKSRAGEVMIDSPWSPAAQILQGAAFTDLTVDSFGVVGNEHLRQDIGGVLSWELGVGPRAADTVYVRSHEYGVHEVLDGFDPVTMKISFLYFGTRERLNVADGEDGLVISSLPSGQSLTLTGVRLADLAPGRVEFHHDQVMEDSLEDAFGFAQEDVTLVDRTVLLTPAAPEGATTDGFQTREGVMDAGGAEDGGAEDGGEGNGGGETGAPGQAEIGRVEIGWAWGQVDVVAGFDAATDVIDFGQLAASQVSIAEIGADLVIEVLDNGGRTVTLAGVQAEDLTRQNLDAAAFNAVLDADGGVVDQLTLLGF